MTTRHEIKSMEPRLAIRPPKQAAPELADFRPALDRAIKLAWAARQADEEGDHDTAVALRLKHDEIFIQLKKFLP